MIPNEQSWEAGLREAYGHGSVGRDVRTLVPLKPDDLLKRDVRSRYVVGEEVARGGMGSVFRTWDKDLQRTVAMKVLSRGHQNTDLLIRFIAEAQIGGQLDHPGIVQVYDLGLDEEMRPYFTMKLIDGETMTAFLARKKESGTDPLRALHLFELVCQTVAFAHARGVVHRDLKPDNVMVGAFGQVHVIDWGFAKIVGADSTVETARAGANSSVSGAAIGTPSYMAPEQALGDIDALDEQTDVFCLGGLLCVILTGDAPYRSGDAEERLMCASRGDLADARARLDACGADAELVALAHRCLSPHKSERPADAAEVAGEIVAYLASVEWRARDAEAAAVEERARAIQARKSKRLAMYLAATIVSVVVAGSGIYWRVQADRREAADRTDRDVAAILSEATRHAEHDEWNLALGAAQRAAERARAGEAWPETKREIEDRLARYSDRERRERLLTAIENVPSRDLDLFHGGDAYAAAFLSYGIDVARLSPKEIGAEVRKQRDRATLIRALDDWATRTRRRMNPVLWRKLLESAGHADDDPWRGKLRRAAMARDRKSLNELADSLNKTPRSSESVILLANALRPVRRAAGSADALSVLRMGAVHHPNDFWIHYSLAVTYQRNRTMGRNIDHDRAVEHARAAFTLRPHATQTRCVLGIALLARSRSSRHQDGDVGAAVTVLDSLASAGREFVHGKCALAEALYAQGDVERARELARSILASNSPRARPSRAALERIVR